jgi:hypothetical protein
MTISACSVRRQKEKLDGYHLLQPGTIRKGGKSILTEALVDSGATGIAFIDQNFAHTNNFELETLSNPRRLEVVDGRLSVAGRITIRHEYLSKCKDREKSCHAS